MWLIKFALEKHIQPLLPEPSFCLPLESGIDILQPNTLLLMVYSTFKNKIQFNYYSEYSLEIEVGQIISLKTINLMTFLVFLTHILWNNLTQSSTAVLSTEF